MRHSTTAADSRNSGGNIPGSTARDQSRAKTDVLKEPKRHGLHRHFTGSSSVATFGSGMKRGFLYGETAPEWPLPVIKNPVSISDLHATIVRVMGIRPNTQFLVGKRPFYATEDGHRRAVDALFT